MATVTLLGSAPALPDAQRDNIYIGIEINSDLILIDCAGSPIQRILQAGWTLDQLRAILLTHHHPDHIYGFPVLLLGLWLHGRKDPLPVYAPATCIRIVEQMMDLFEWNTWPQMFPVDFHPLSETEETTIQLGPFKIRTAPVKHLIPTLAVRVTAPTGGTMVYSSDTEPCPTLIELARNADLLFHESTGPHSGHSSAQQAGFIAQQANVRRLVLVHYPSPDSPIPQTLIEQAAIHFNGPITLGRDFDRFSF